MINYFFQNVSLVLPIISIFFYVTVIFGAPPIKALNFDMQFFGKQFTLRKMNLEKVP